MIGTIVGDIYGSLYEQSRTASRVLPTLNPRHCFTDDTVISLAVAEHLLHGTAIRDAFKQWIGRYPNAGYGKMFREWATTPNAPDLVSFGNGALMRIGPVALLASSLAVAREQAWAITASTHGHDSALSAVDTFVQLHWYALHGATRSDLLAMWTGQGGKLHTLESVREAGSKMHIRADSTLTDVMSCLAESEDFDSLLTACLYHGGDTDTIAAIAGTLGEALWGVPEERIIDILPFLDTTVREGVREFYSRLSGMPPALWLRFFSDMNEA